MLEILTNYILAAMISWVPLNQHNHLEEEEVTSQRYHDIAETIAEVSLDPTLEPLFEGEDGRVKTALLLASVASSESNFQNDVDTCHRGGDLGLAWGLWQTHAPKILVCSDRKVAVKIALEMMRYSFQHCHHLALDDRMSIYTDGKCHKNWRRSKFKVNRAISYINSNSFQYDIQ